ncbi:MAG: hypothetical protein J7L15_06600 [Clostridiales bacterium]|nr:hypothetical protein [Clostridiales bacterium]
MKNILDYYMSKPEQVQKMVDSLTDEKKKEYILYWGDFKLRYRAGNYGVKIKDVNHFLNIPGFYRGNGEITKKEFIFQLINEVRRERNKKPYNRFNILDLEDG